MCQGSQSIDILWYFGDFSTPTQFLEANGIRFAYRKSAKRRRPMPRHWDRHARIHF
jgi:hypothetical protein